jgi:hypothetical protein
VQVNDQVEVGRRRAESASRWTAFRSPAVLAG